MFLSQTKDILAALRSVIDATQDSPVLLAVAFWGDGAEALLREDRRYKIICNLSVGGTNPRTIRTLAARHDVKHHPLLHAKVVIGSNAALVGSANLSERALAFSETPADHWREAVSLVERQSDDYAAARNWFFDIWQSARNLDEDTLLRAEDSFRSNKFRATQGRATTQEHIEPELSEILLFADGPIKERNRIRMAGKILNDAFERHIEALNESNIRVPAFAANLLWTLASHSVETKIADCPRFTTPDQVIYRTTEPRIQPKKSIDQLWALILALTEDAQVPFAIRHWASKWKQRPEELRNVGVHPRRLTQEVR